MMTTEGDDGAVSDDDCTIFTAALTGPMLTFASPTRRFVTRPSAVELNARQ